MSAWYPKEALERENLSLCVYEPAGCAQVAKTDEIAEHHSKCLFRKISCFDLDNCGWTGPMIKLSDHVRSDHPESEIKKLSFYMTWQEATTFKVYTTSELYIFKVTCNESNFNIEIDVRFKEILEETYGIEVWSKVSRSRISFVRRFDNTSAPIDMKILKAVDPEGATIKVVLPNENTCGRCKNHLTLRWLTCESGHAFCLKCVPIEINVCDLCGLELTVECDNDDLSSMHAPHPVYVCHNDCSFMTYNTELVRHHENVCFCKEDVVMYKPIVSVPIDDLGVGRRFFCCVKDNITYKAVLSCTQGNYNHLLNNTATSAIVPYLYDLNVDVTQVTDPYDEEAFKDRFKSCARYIVIISDGGDHPLIYTNPHPVHRPMELCIDSDSYADESYYAHRILIKSINTYNKNPFIHICIV